MERLNKDIKEHNFRHFYLLYGDEAYLRLKYKDSLVKGIIGEDTMNYSYFEGKDIDINAVIDLAETMPFFADRRLIVIENSGLLKEGGERLADYLSGMPDYLYIVMSEYETDMRSKLSKVCKNIGTCVEMKPYEGYQMKMWVASKLKKAGKKMTENDIEYLLKTAGSDMTMLNNEIDKLINYAAEREIVTSKDVDLLVTRQIDNNIFDMISAIGNRNQRVALDIYYDMLTLREAPAKILSLIARQYNLLLQTKELISLRETDKVIASKIGVPPFFVKEYTSQARLYSQDELKKAFEKCVIANEDIRIGKLKDVLAVELLIIELSHK